MKKLFLFAALTAVAFLLHSCANVSSPSGGKKDEKKPRLTKTSPKNGTTKFKGKSITFTFSEWVDENKLKEQILITPNIPEYKHSVDKNTFKLLLDSGSLLPNTTYYINLREGIKDVTEGNTADSVTLVFSTGKLLDSLFLTGTTTLMLENKKEKNITVALFDVTDTFTIEKSTPVYVTKTDGSGNFTFSYLKKGSYFLYAFNDVNKNSKYDKNKEHLGYAPESILVDGTTLSQDLYLVNEDHEKPKKRGVEALKKRIVKMYYQKPIKHLEIKKLRNYDMNISYIIKQDEISIFTDKLNNDTVRLNVEATDFAGNISSDTIKAIFTYIDTTRNSLSILPAQGSEIEPNQYLTLSLSKPFLKFRPRIEIKMQGKLYIGNDLTELVDFVEIQSLASVQIIPKKDWTDTLTITVYPQSFQPVSGKFTDTLKAKYSMKSLEKYGSIGGSVETSSKNFIVQLLSKDGKILNEVFNQNKFLFQYLQDGEYRISVVDDVNKNKKWDQGDYRKKQLPEHVYHFPDVIKLKSNWEILDVKIRF